MPVSKRGRRRRGALERPQRGHDEQERSHERGDGVSRQAENERVAAHGERQGLPGAHGDAPEDLLRAQFLERCPNEVVRPDGDSSRRHEHVRLEPTEERRPVRRLVVGDALARKDDRSGRAQQRGEHDAVRLVDLARGEGLARPPELRPGRHDRDARPGSAVRMRHTRGSEGRQPRGRHGRAREQYRSARADVASQRPHVVSFGDGTWNAHRAVLLAHVLDRDDGVGALGDDPARGDPHCLPGRQRARRRAPGRDAGDDRERARRVGRPQREAVHRRAREARQVDGREGVLRQHPSRSILERHRLRRERPDALQHAGERVLDGQEAGHGADGTHGVRSPRDLCRRPGS